MSPRTLMRMLFLVLGALAATALALCVGEVPLALRDLPAALLGRGDALAVTVLHELRLPRALAAFACGGLLALAGTLMQLLLRNPLADPYVLGVSGGASLGALAAMLSGMASGVVEAMAFAGALAAMLLVFALAHGDGSWTRTRLLLTGVVVAAGCGAGVSLLLVLAPERRLPGMLFWLMGDVSAARNPGLALAVLAVVLAACMPWARDFNLLARGETLAQSLGVATRPLRWMIFLAGSLATAVAVSLVGAVGFVGLLVPHAVRMWLGNDQRVMLPAVVLAGGMLLVVADTVARSIVSPLQLPVGALTALIGVPAFLWMLSRHMRGAAR